MKIYFLKVSLPPPAKPGEESVTVHLQIPPETGPNPALFLVPGWGSSQSLVRELWRQNRGMTMREVEFPPLPTFSIEVTAKAFAKHPGNVARAYREAAGNEFESILRPFSQAFTALFGQLNGNETGIIYGNELFIRLLAGFFGALDAEEGVILNDEGFVFEQIEGTGIFATRITGQAKAA